MHTVEELDLQNPDLDVAEALVEVSNRLSVEREPRPTFLTRDDWLVFLNSPGSIRRHFFIRDDSGTPVAQMGSIYPDDGTNPHMLRTLVSVDPRSRRQGMATSLLRVAVDMAKDLGRTEFAGYIFDTVDAAGPFLDAVGGKRMLDHRHSGVAIADLDQDLLRSWVEEGPSRAPGYSVEIYEGAPPERLLESLAHLYFVLERDMPTPEGQEPRAWDADLLRNIAAQYLKGGENLTAVAIEDATGEAAGMSQLYRLNSDHATWMVTTTMVDPEHRGRALGKWVKGAVNLEAFEQWPGGEFQETGNAQTNDAMLSINEAMGFEVEFTMSEVAASVEAVEAYLERRST